MIAQRAAVKKYIVKLSDEEREQLNTLIQKGKHRARQLVKARISSHPSNSSLKPACLSR